MRVEPIGDLFAEPKTADTYFQAQLSTEPITILNPNSNYLSGKEKIFSELNQEGGTVIIGRKDLNLSFENEHHLLPSGFFLTEEEWLLFKQPHLGLEPYERKKMGSLPKSFTPFSLISAGGGLESRALSNGIASDSIWLRKCESLAATPSLPYFNEPNNNTLSHPPSLSKLFSQQSQSKDILQEEDEKENWLGNVASEGEKTPQFGIVNNFESNSSAGNLSSGPEARCLTNELDNHQHPVSVHGFAMDEQGMDLIRDLATGVITGYGLQSCIQASVGTIGSHPEPITCSSLDQIHTPSHNHCPPAKVTKPSGDSPSAFSFSSSSGIGQDQDWLSKSLQWSNYNDTDHDQSYSNSNLTAENTTAAIPYHSIDFPYIQQPPARTDEMETLLTFLSKFDDKVAAIWGQDGAAAAIAANLQYATGYSSTSSTPVGNSNPWGSEKTAGQGYYDYQAMQIQIEQQQQALDESQRAAERFSQRHYVSHRKDFPQQLKPNPSNRIAIGASRISPPKGKYTIMHSMKQHFGIAPSEEEYHIVRKTDAGSNEEKEKSLQTLNHHEELSAFVTFLPELQRKPEKKEVPKRPATKPQPSEIDISNMQDVLNSLDLEFEEELEIMAACKGDPKPFIEQASQEDLLNSWKTHFTTIEVLETSDIGPMASPVTTLGAHQINPNLPEYRLFDGDEQDYSIFKRPGRTMFPVRYKLRWENEKSVQTEDFGETYYDMQPEASYRLSAFDWESYLPGHSDPFCLSSRSRTPVDPRIIFDYENGLEIQTSDWFSDGNGVGSGSLADFEYNGSVDGGGVGGGGGSHLYLQPDYCCDSGIGIDGSSRAEFYDDVFPDYEGDYEYVGAGYDDAGISLQGYSATNDNDIDYGHFQGFPCHPGSSSSVSGKQGKGNRRRAKVKPCKYFFLDGSCRRGNDCKFSHDLTTCRYWAEGSCLKGESCPYLHCFLERKEFPLHGEFKNFGRENYHLESENDFPALGGSTKRNSMLSSRAPMSAGFSSSSVYEEGVGDSSESLLMLADPAGSIYSGFGDMSSDTSETRGYGKRKNEAVGTSRRKTAMGEQRWFPDMGENYNNKGMGRSFGDGGAGTSIPWTRHGTNKGNGHNSNSNSWISMISVKEKRKKKKH